MSGPDLLDEGVLPNVAGFLYCPGSRDEVSHAQNVYRSYLRHVLDLFGAGRNGAILDFGLLPQSHRY